MTHTLEPMLSLGASLFNPHIQHNKKLQHRWGQVWNMTNDDGDVDPMVCGGMQEFDKSLLLRGGTSREEQLKRANGTKTRIRRF